MRTPGPNTYHLTRGTHKPPVRFQASLVAVCPWISLSWWPNTTSPKVTEKKFQPLLIATKSESFSNNPFLRFQFNGQIKFLPHKWNATCLLSVKYHTENVQYEHFTQRAINNGDRSNTLKDNFDLLRIDCGELVLPSMTIVNNSGERGRGQRPLGEVVGGSILNKHHSSINMKPFWSCFLLSL